MTDVPGIGYGEYYKLKDILDKQLFQTKHVLFEVKGNLVFADGKPIQGLKIVEDSAYIKGVHYTSWENATQIRSMMNIESSRTDPFVYLAPKGVMQEWSEKLICRELGARSADTKVILEIVVPIEKVWIKASRNVVHFAIEKNLFSDEIMRLDIQRRRQSS